VTDIFAEHEKLRKDLADFCDECAVPIGSKSSRVFLLQSFALKEAMDILGATVYDVIGCMSLFADPTIGVEEKLAQSKVFMPTINNDISEINKWMRDFSDVREKIIDTMDEVNGVDDVFRRMVVSMYATIIGAELQHNASKALDKITDNESEFDFDNLDKVVSGAFKDSYPERASRLVLQMTSFVNVFKMAYSMNPNREKAKRMKEAASEIAWNGLRIAEFGDPVKHFSISGLISAEQWQTKLLDDFNEAINNIEDNREFSGDVFKHLIGVAEGLEIMTLFGLLEPEQVIEWRETWNVLREFGGDNEEENDSADGDDEGDEGGGSSFRGGYFNLGGSPQDISWN
jgi:hypothetical protein